MEKQVSMFRLADLGEEPRRLSILCLYTQAAEEHRGVGSSVQLCMQKSAPRFPKELREAEASSARRKLCVFADEKAEHAWLSGAGSLLASLARLLLPLCIGILGADFFAVDEGVGRILNHAVALFQSADNLNGGSIILTNRDRNKMSNVVIAENT